MRVDIESIFAKAPSPFVLVDRELRMLWANEAYLKVTGRTRDQIIGRVMTEEFPAEPNSISDQMLRSSFDRVFDSGEVDHLPLIPYPIAQPDGTTENKYWSATHTPITGADGRVQFVLQNTHDVTTLYENRLPGQDLPTASAEIVRRAEAVALRNLELDATTGFMRNIFDQAPSFMQVVTGPELVVSLVNQSYRRIIGPGREVIGRSLRELFPEVEGQGYFEMYEEVLATGKIISHRGAPVDLDDPIEGRKRLFIDFNLTPLVDADGKPMAVLLQGHDVTAQKTAEAQLIEAEERFRLMAQLAPNHIWTADETGAIEWVNDTVYSYSGRDANSLMGDKWGDIVHPDDYPHVAKYWAECVAQGFFYETEFRMRAASGEYRWFLVRAAPVRGADGKVRRWIGTNTDIQDRKNAELDAANLNALLEERVAQRTKELEEVSASLRQSQKMEAIGNLAGGIAHDFNNLLQTMTGSLQLVARDLPEGSAGRERLALAMRAVERGATLASHLLSFSRRQPLAPKTINLSRLLQDADHILRSAVGEGVEVAFEIDGALWNTSVDRTNFDNALLNLAINARDAMNWQGKLTIAAENAAIAQGVARQMDIDAGEYVMLTVRDTGSGMSPEIMEKVFEPFFTTKSEEKGTGLGMSMVYGFVKQSGGHIKLSSQPGKGTEIQILLPRSKNAEEAMPDMPSGEAPGGSETVLVVEDNDDVLLLTSTMLTDLGYTVITARDADRAMEVVDSGEPLDLIFTDVVMPGTLTSREMTERALEKSPGLKVLFTSGYTENSIVHGGRLDKGVELLNKPYTREALARKLREVLEKPADRQGGVGSAAEGQGARFAGLRVLICEDDPIIRMNLAETLELAGCIVDATGEGQAALTLARAQKFEFLVTDIGLPDISGRELATSVQECQPDIAVIFATGDATGAGVPLPRTASLQKPFSDTELLAVLAGLLEPA